MTHRPILLVLWLPLLFSGCAAAEADVSTALADLTKAKNLVGIAEGIAGVAVLADPALAVIVNPIIAALNVAEAPSMTVALGSTPDAAAIEAQAAKLTDLASTLETQTAQVVHVAPNP